MKKIIYSLLFLSLIGGSVTGYSYYKYIQREAQIISVLKFKETAFKAYGTLANGEYKKAKTLYEEALKLHDKDSKTLRDYALALSKLGENKKACKIYEKAYLLDATKSETVLINLANICLKIEDHKKSAKYFKEAIERYRPKYRYIESLIISLKQLNKEDEAMGYYAYVMENNPEYFEGKFENLKTKYTKDTKAHNLAPKYDATQDIYKLLEIAREYKKQGYDKKALISYYKIIEQTKTNDIVNKEVTELLLKHSDTKNALVYLQHIENKGFDELFKIGGIYHQTKKYQQAIDHYEKALKIKETPMLLKNLTACSFYTKDINKVEKYLSRLKEIDGRLAYKFEHAMLVKSGIEITQKDKILYQLYDVWFDFKEKIKG